MATSDDAALSGADGGALVLTPASARQQLVRMNVFLGNFIVS